MPTQTSQLVGNLSKIYNVKLQLKNVLQTNSDIFEDYPSIAESLIGEGGEIPAGYTYVSGTSYITTNGSHDISSYAYAYVTVEGGGGETVTVDPWYDDTEVNAMIENEETTADYVRSRISENFTVTLDQNEENVEAVEWDFYEYLPTGETDQDDNPIYEQKTIHVIVSSNDEHGELNIAIDIAQDLEDYSGLYDCIYPILENATLTASEDPSNDGYDYLLEGDLYAWNLNDCSGGVQEVTVNGLYTADGGWAGFNVNVEPTFSDEEKINLFCFSDTQDEPVEYTNLPYEKIVVWPLLSYSLVDPESTMDCQCEFSDYDFQNQESTASVMFENYYTGATVDGRFWVTGGKNLDSNSETDTFNAIIVSIMSGDSYDGEWIVDLQESFTIESTDEVEAVVWQDGNDGLYYLQLFINGFGKGGCFIVTPNE